MRTRFRTSARFAVAGVALALIAAACGSDDKSSDATTGAAAGTNPAATGSGAAIKLAANPWKGSAANAAVAKVVLESKLGTPTTVVDLDENASWVGLDSGDLDANLEIWPSGHVADRATYIDEKKSVVDIGLLGPKAKIGWYVPTFVVDQHPELKSWEGFKDPELAKLFATAESGDQGQFLMGDPSYVSYDEQIITNLGLPLKFVVAGSEAALITAIQQAEADQKPLLLQFWTPHWLFGTGVKLTQVELPPVTDACLASKAAADGKYACDYPIDDLYKAANAGLEAKNKVAFDFLSKFQLTIDQQNEIAGQITDTKTADVVAKEWVDSHPDIVAAWLA